MVPRERFSGQAVDSRRRACCPWSPPGRGQFLLSSQRWLGDSRPCCLLAAAVHAGAVLHVLFLSGFLKIVVVPRPWLRARHDAGDVGILAGGVGRGVRTPDLGFVPPTEFLLLALLPRTLARTFLLRYFRSAR